jgi:hypothetical protein
MPITAKLSNKFYERLGDDVANELVEWLNLVDSSYRQEFKELFDANFGRVEARLVAIEQRMSDLEVRLEARMDAKLADLKSELLKWMFVFWVGTMGTVLAIVKL